MGIDLDAAADELYGLPIDRFTGARNAMAKELSASGDKATAAALRRLRKPSHAAWLANLLARRHPQEIEEVLDLGGNLREAQNDARGDDLRSLSASRQALVRRVLRLVSEDAKEAGTPFGTTTQRQIVATLEAAMADESSGRALAAGRLAEALSHVGFGGGAAPDRSTLTRRRQPREEPQIPTTPGHDRLRAALADAEKRLVDARSAMDAATVTLDQARTRHDAARSRYREVEEELRRAEQTVEESAQELQKATARQKREARTLRAAEAEFLKREAAASGP